MKQGEQNIQGLMPDGTLVPISLTVQDGKPVVQEMFSDLDLKDSEENCEKSVSGFSKTFIHIAKK